MAAAGGAVIAAAAWRRARAGSPAAAGRGRPAPPPHRAGRAARRAIRWTAEPSAGTRDPGRFELLPEAYRPVPHGLHGRVQRARAARRAPRARARRARAAPRRPSQTPAKTSPRRASSTAATGAASAPAPAASAASERRPARAAARAPCASARAVAMPIRRPVKPPGPDADGDPLDARPTPTPASAERLLERAASSRAACSPREPARRVVARLDHAPVGEQHAGDGRRASRCRARARITRATSIRRRSPPACASVTCRAIARPPSSASDSARSGHSTNVTVSGAEVRVEQPGVLVVEARRGGRGRGARAGPRAPS